jgi:predicted signal transduction protein with EAL and GGDEF domain
VTGPPGFSSILPCWKGSFNQNGDERWLDISKTMIEFDGTLASLFSAFDLTERKHAEAEVQLLAVTDPLTGLGNYRRLVEALDAEVKRTRCMVRENVPPIEH